MTHAEALVHVNKTVSYHIKETPLACSVKVCAVRHEYGRARFHITPLHGTGLHWVDETSLRFTPEKGK